MAKFSFPKMPSSPDESIINDLTCFCCSNQNIEQNVQTIWNKIKSKNELDFVLNVLEELSKPEIPLPEEPKLIVNKRAALLGNMLVEIYAQDNKF